MTDAQKRAAIVTGASKGIGAEVAKTLARDGISVLVNYASSAEAAAKIVAEIEAEGGYALAECADISELGAIEHLFDTAESAFGGVDILVNNAGMMSRSPVAETDDEAFERQIALNLGGVFRGMREGAQRLRDGGRIISVSSSVVGLYQPTYGVYAATKAAIEALTKVLAKELGPRGITANSVAPGPVETEFFMTGKSDELVQTIVSANPLGRLGQPADIAGVVSFLASEQGGWVNGQTLRANGGVV